MKTHRRLAWIAMGILGALLAPAMARAQCSSYTTVTGTITDANSVPYATGTITADLIPSGGSPVCTPASGGTKLPFSTHVGPTPLDSTGSFTMQLPPNSIVTPSGTQWTFTVAMAPAVSPPIGAGPVSFQVTLTISGATQNVSSSLSAAAPKLCPFCGNSTGSGTVNATPIHAPVVGAGPGTVATVGPSSNCSPPVANGMYQVLYNVTGAAAVDPSCPQLGALTTSITGSTNTYTVLYSDNASTITHDVAGTVPVTITLPTATTLGNPNFEFKWCNHSPQTDSIVPTTWTIQQGNAAAGASISVPSGACDYVTVDANSSTNWHADVTGTSSAPNQNAVYLSPNCGTQTNCYSVYDDAKMVWDAAFTNTSQTVTCPNNDCAFTSADVGKIVFGTNSTITFQSSASVVVPQGTISAVNSASSITVSVAATASCTASGTQGCLLIWGHDDSDKLIAAYNAAANSPVCATLMLPVGEMLVQKGEFNANPTLTGPCVLGAGNSLQSIGISGAGVAANTLIIPTPNFDYTTCTGGVTGKGCFLGAEMLSVQHLTIFGAGQQVSSQDNIGVELNGGSILGNIYARDLSLLGWNASTSHFVGLEVNSVSIGYLNFVNVIGFGQINCESGLSAQIVEASQINCVGGGNTASAGATAYGLLLGDVSATHYWYSSESYYGNCFGTASNGCNAVAVGTNQFFVSNNDQILQTQAGATGNGLLLTYFSAPPAGVAILNGDILEQVTGAATGPLWALDLAGTGVAKISNSQITATGSHASALQTITNAALYELPGNHFSTVTANVIGATSICASNSLAVTVAQLCSGPDEGSRASVTDANSTTFNAAAAGSGTNHMGVRYNGSGWVID